MPVRDGGSSTKPGPPLRGTSSWRQRAPASSCQTGGDAARWHAPPNSTSASRPPARARRTVTASNEARSSLNLLVIWLATPGPQNQQARRRATRLRAWSYAAESWLPSVENGVKSHPLLPHPLHLGPNLRVPHQGRDGGRRGRGERVAAAVGMACAAARVQRHLQHAQLLRRHRHLVRRVWFQVVDPSLVVIRRSVRPWQLDVLLILQLLEQVGVSVGGRRKATATNPCLVDERRRPGAARLYQSLRPDQVVLGREHDRPGAQPQA